MVRARIFVVEDDAAIALLLQDRLAELGYEPCGTASSGADAIRKIEFARPDLVLMDISLSGRMDGIQTASKIRGSFNVAIVYVTGYSDPATLEQARATQPYGYLIKPFTDNDLRAAIEIALSKHQADTAAAALERERLERAISEASEAERRRLGQDLHDGLGQHLTGVAFLCKVLEQKLERRSVPETADASAIAGLIAEAIQRTREIARGLLPVDPGPGGLSLALQRLAEQVQSQTKVDCELKSDAALHISDPAIATHLYRIAQEAVNNAVKHARAGRIEIRLGCDNEAGLMTIRDDGVGFEGIAKSDSGRGLQIMKHRAHTIGGVLQVLSGPSGGTVVTCTFPINH
jgi:signal transduction histidine kinase